MTLDILAAAFCGWLALCMFVLHIISSKMFKNWLNLPEYLRWGLIATGATFMIRSVNFCLLTSAPNWVAGKINPLGMLALICLTYTGTAITVWALRRWLPDQGWMRMDWVEREQRKSASNVPLIVPMAVAEAMARRDGFTVNEDVYGPD